MKKQLWTLSQYNLLLSWFLKKILEIQSLFKWILKVHLKIKIFQLQILKTLKIFLKKILNYLM